VTQSGVLGLANRRLDLDLQDIERIEAGIGEEQTGPIKIRLNVASKYGDTIELDLRIKDVDKRSEALDVLFSIARRCGFKNWSIQSNEADLMIVEVNSRRENDSNPIPESTQLARYDLDRPAVTVPTPSLDVGDFDPEAYQNWHIKLDSWQPGNQVRFYRPAISGSATIMVGAFIGLLIAGFLAFACSEMRGTWRVGVPAAGGVIGFLGGIVVFRVRNPEYEVLIDKRSNRISWRTGLRSNFRPLSEVQQVILREFEQTVKPKNRPSYTLYLCRLFVKLAGDSEILLTENDDWDRSDDGQRHSLEPLANAVGVEIGVPWRWRSYQPSVVNRIVWRYGASGDAIILDWHHELFCLGYVDARQVPRTARRDRNTTRRNGCDRHPRRNQHRRSAHFWQRLLCRNQRP
jgi:hypothetical protein